MRGRALWLSIAFLALTAAAITWEVVAAFDGNPDTWPWTQLITTYVPWWVTYPVLVGLFVWLVFHFYGWYRKRRRGQP